MVAGCDPGDVRAVLRAVGRRVERELAVAVVQAGRREGARDDHLRGRVRALALGKARRHREACGREERVRLVYPVVDDPDLHALARGRKRRPPQLRGADHGRAAEERSRVADARGDACYSLQRGDPPLGPGGCDHRHAVENDLVAPAHPRVRHGLFEPPFEGVLPLGERRQVRPAGPTGHSGRGLLQEHDELDEARARRARAGRRSSVEKQRHECR